MRKKSAVEHKLSIIIDPVLGAMDLELVDLELRREAGGLVLRIFIDSPEGVDLDTCTDASNAISGALEIEDPIEGTYNLEVSSPGIERPLTKNEHFIRFVGERAKVKTFKPIDGRRDFTGVIGEADATGFEMDVEGRRYRIDYDEVAKANLRPEIKF
ncbi:MAG: ribosome maturation factor RimP [Actinobacteria bacterium]|nr:ribosome maturation factor RimP [Actinomycetota bacterium]